MAVVLVKAALTEGVFPYLPSLVTLTLPFQKGLLVSPANLPFWSPWVKTSFVQFSSSPSGLATPSPFLELCDPLSVLDPPSL